MIKNSRILESPINTLVADVTGYRDQMLSEDPNQVKVAVAESGEALWFSRAPMRGSKLHCGVYLFTAEILRMMGWAPTTELSRTESLEQLAWLEYGYRIHTTQIEKLPLSINTPEDFEKFKQIVEGKND